MRFEMDNNTKEALESIEYPIIDNSQACHNYVKNSSGEYSWYGCGYELGRQYKEQKLIIHDTLGEEFFGREQGILQYRNGTIINESNNDVKGRNSE